MRKNKQKTFVRTDTVEPPIKQGMFIHYRNIITILLVCCIVLTIFGSMKLYSNFKVFKDILDTTYSEDMGSRISNLDVLNNFISEDNVVSKSDKENVYFSDGTYVVVRDDVIRQIQYYDVVPYEGSLLNYLDSFEGFSRNNATIICTAMDGTKSTVDLSTAWKDCSFGEFVAYWKTPDSKGVMVTLYPVSTAIVNEYLYYSDLSELFEEDTEEVSSED